MKGVCPEVGFIEDGTVKGYPIGQEAGSIILLECILVMKIIVTNVYKKQENIPVGCVPPGPSSGSGYSPPKAPYPPSLEIP